MKEYITWQRIKPFFLYHSLETGDHRFFCISQLFNRLFRAKELITWFYDENNSVTGNEFIDIYKEKHYIEIYDQSEAFADETISRYNLNSEKKFIISKENFVTILQKWEEFRITLPDIILIVIHEDNHVSLETEPHIIKEYQNAGYAFDIKKKSL